MCCLAHCTNLRYMSDVKESFADKVFVDFSRGLTQVDSANVLDFIEETTDVVEAAGGVVNIIGSTRNAIGMDRRFSDMDGEEVTFKFKPETMVSVGRYEAKDGSAKMIVAPSYTILAVHPDHGELESQLNLDAQEIKALSFEIENAFEREGFTGTIRVGTDEYKNVRLQNVQFEGVSLKELGRDYEAEVEAATEAEAAKAKKTPARRTSRR